MGAKARVWVNRGLVLLAVIAGVALILFLPVISAVTKVAILAVAAGVGAVIAFKWIPAFDPFGRVRWRLSRRAERVCAVTFDDGPSADTARVIDVLARHQVKATFFVLAANARRHPGVLCALVQQGHTVAVHGVTHRKLQRDTQVSVERELVAAMGELSSLGVPPARLYRPPHGLKSAAMLRAARAQGCQVWAWSRGIWDTDRPDAEVLVRRVTRLARSRMVLLLHDGRGDEERPDIEPMLAALPRILDRLRADGFTFSTLDRA